MGTVPALPATIKFLLGSVPALVTVIFAGLIALIALALDKERRDYALDMADRFVQLAAVLVGQPPRNPRPRTPPPQLPGAGGQSAP